MKTQTTKKGTLKNQLFAGLLCLTMTLTLLPVSAATIATAIEPAAEHSIALTTYTPKTYTFTSEDTAAEDNSSGIRAHIFYKGDTIVFTPDEIEPFSSTDKGKCHTPTVGLRFRDVDGLGVTGGICKVNETSLDGSDCMVSFTITSDDPVTMRFCGAGPTGIQSPPPPHDAGENFFAYRFHELEFSTHPNTYPIVYDLGTNGSWPKDASYPTEITLDGSSDTFTLQLLNPVNSDSRYHFVDWDISINAILLSSPLSYIIPINGVGETTVKTEPVFSVTPPSDTECITITANWSNVPQTAAPAYSPNGGTYSTTQLVTLTSTTPMANIFYTTDGTLPWSSSSSRERYTEPIEVSSTTTITAIAYPPGSNMAESEIVSRTFVISDELPSPVSSTNAITPTNTPTPTTTIATTLPPVDTIAQPTSVKATAGNGSVKLTWAKVSGASGYHIYRNTGSKWTAYKKITGENTLSYTNTGLKAGTKYSYKVYAYKTVGGTDIYSTESESVNATPKLSTPTLKTPKASSTSIKLTWTKPAGYASGYVVYRNTRMRGTYKAIKTIKQRKKLTWTNTKLARGKRYYYKLRAYVTVSGKRVYSRYSNVKKCKTQK